MGKLILIILSATIAIVMSDSKSIRKCVSRKISINAYTKKTPNTIIKTINSINVTLKINFFSRDSIIATTTFINKSSEDFMLYKSLLPSNELKEAIFNILFTDSLENLLYGVDLKKKSSGEKYYAGDANYFPEIDPHMGKENFISLKSRSILSYNVNLVNSFNLKKGSWKKGKNYLSIYYVAYMPLILNSSHVKEIDSIDGKKKPVFIKLQTQKCCGYVYF